MGAYAYPRVAGYIASLPAGLESYPHCVQKGSLSRMWLAESPPLREKAQLPEPLRRMIESPPLPSTWIPEVYANAIYLALLDEHFTSEDEFVSFCYRLNVELFRSPLYRAITMLPAATALLHATRLGWGFFRKGTSIAMPDSSDESVRIRVAWPPHVTPRVMARCFLTVFKAGVEATRVASHVAVHMSDFHKTGATYDATWKRRAAALAAETRG